MQKQLRRFIIGDLIFVGLMVLLTQVLFAIGVNRIVVLTATTTLISVALIVLASTFVQNRRNRSTIQRIVAGEHWAHWHYDWGVWRSFAADERMRTHAMNQETTPAQHIRNVVMYTVSAVAVGTFIGMMRSSVQQAIQVGVIMGAVVCIVSLLFAVHAYRRLYTPPPADVVDVYIGSLGICLPEQYISLSEPHVSLVEARVQPGTPPIFLLETRFGSSVNRSVPQTIAIPVPPGYETEAQTLAERFQAEIAQRQALLAGDS